MTLLEKKALVLGVLLAVIVGLLAIADWREQRKAHSEEMDTEA